MSAIEEFLKKQQLFRCDRLDASITKRQCQANRTRPDNQAKDIPEIHSCKKCPGLGAEVKIMVEDGMGKPRLCKNTDCNKQAQKDGLCKAHLNGTAPRASHGNKALTAARPTPAWAGHAIDPRETFECPHCQCALSSAEVEGVECPACGKLLHSHVDKAGDVFTPPGEVIDESGWAQPVLVTVPESFGLVVNAEGKQAASGTDPVVVLALREAWHAKEAEWLADLSGLKPGQTIAWAVSMVAAVEGLGY
jgi:hypothetical protein